MKVLAILTVLVSAVTAFVPSAGTVSSTTALNAEENGRREFFSQAAAAAAFLGAVAPANAIRDYEGIALLGGSNIVDINNANIRAYLKMQGMYPTVAGKIVSNGPYNSVGDLYKIPGLSGKESDIIKKYESRFTTREPSADFVIDRFNNGLYR